MKFEDIKLFSVIKLNGNFYVKLNNSPIKNAIDSEGKFAHVPLNLDVHVLGNVQDENKNEVENKIIDMGQLENFVTFTIGGKNYVKIKRGYYADKNCVDMEGNIKSLRPYTGVKIVK